MATADVAMEHILFANSKAPVRYSSSVCGKFETSLETWDSICLHRGDPKKRDAEHT